MATFEEWEREIKGDKIGVYHGCRLAGWKGRDAEIEALQSRIDELERENDRYAQIESKALTEAMARIDAGQKVAQHYLDIPVGQMNPGPVRDAVDTAREVATGILAALGPALDPKAAKEGE